MAEIKKIKPSLPKGTRDFLPQEVAKRNYIFDTIKSVFRKYGFQQIDTPAFERLETLTGKYGEEGDRLLFKILNSGDYLKDAPDAELQAKNSSAITRHISEKGLRYDLTVPLSRYVVQHQSELTFPFKRFHIGPVWRADRPGKGRYQEFYQCDADVIGSTSLLNEIELTQIYSEVYSKLGMDVTIRLNNRKFIDEFLTRGGITDKKTEVTTLIDKLDKVEWSGEKGIAEQIKANGISDAQLAALSKTLFDTSYDELKTTFSEAVVAEIDYVMSRVGHLANVQFDPTLMRGLDYYTGMVWEVKPNNVQMGSLGGGGRYDNLTEMFGGRDMSGVGISFGVERIYDVMEELNLFPATLVESTKVLFVHFDEASEAYGFDQLQKVRAQDIASEVYPGKKKLDKQMNYANDKKIPYVVVIGGDEMASGKLTFKNMASGQQDKLTIDEIIERLKSLPASPKGR
ncbi:MAG: histidine--tRNA ligase [Bacteroidetes bacterium]|nr:histidine--tRNA ligase [Bacteroidota bacterium]